MTDQSITGAWIGDAADAPDGTCMFAVEPGDPRCGKPASVHILAESAIYGAVGLVACATHAPIARDMGGPPVGEHPYGPGCIGPETWWREDGCVRPETSGAVQSITGETSDGYHTFNELYRHRMLLTAALAKCLFHADNRWNAPVYQPHKSWRHSDGEMIDFGEKPGDWFIVVFALPTGQVSYHYPAADWDHFQIPERRIPAEFDGHTAAEAADRLEAFLRDS